VHCLGSSKKVYNTIWWFISRLFTSIVWTGIQLYLLVVPIDIIRYIFGPLPRILCLAHIVSKNMINIQAVLFWDAVTSARYLFVFHLKNPFVFIYLPGQQPINFYICAGLNPQTAIAEPDEAAPKKNHILNILLVLSMFLQLAVAFKFIIHRMKMDSASSYAYIESFKKDNLFDFLISSFFVSAAFSYGYLVVAIQTVPPETLNEHPNYMLMYGLHFWFPIGSCLIFVVLFYTKNKQMRETLFNELVGLFTRDSNNS